MNATEKKDVCKIHGLEFRQWKPVWTKGRIAHWSYICGSMVPDVYKDDVDPCDWQGSKSIITGIEEVTK